MSSDLRLALRKLRAEPAAAFAVTLILGGAIAAATVLGALFDAIVDDLPPVASADAIARLWLADETRAAGHRPASAADYRAWAEGTRTLEHLSATVSTEVMFGDANAQRINVLHVTPEYFSLVGRAPQLGRVLASADAGSRAVLISDRLWRGRFDARPSVVGRALALHAQPATIVGVMPAAFWFPARGADVWMLLDPESRDEVEIAGRLRPGVTWSDVAAEFGVLAGRTAVPARSNARVLVRSPRQEARIRLGPGLRGLVAPAVAILLIACANIGNVLVTRGVDRRREFAIRTALGARPLDLVRTSAADAVVLVILGGGVGLLLAPWGLALLRTAIAAVNPDLADGFGGDRALVAIVGGCTAAALIGTSLWPAVAALRRDAARTLAHRAVYTRFARVRYGVGDLLLVLQVAFAVVLVLVTALLVRFASEMMAAEVPAAAGHVLSARVSVDASIDGLARKRALDRIVDAAAATPGVRAAAIATAFPARTDSGPLSDLIVGSSSGTSTCRARVVRVSRGYFATLALEFVEGAVSHGGSAVMSTTAAEQCGGGAAAGRQVRVDMSADWLPVTGIAVDPFPARVPPPGVSSALIWIVDPPGWPADVYLLADASAAAAPRLTHALALVSGHLAVEQPATVRSRVSALAGQAAIVVGILAAVAALALVLAFTGVYAAASRACASRLVELGVRLAMGATPRSLALLALQRDAPLVAAGIVAGTVGTMWVTAIVWRQLLVVSAADPITLLTAAAVVAAAAILAALGPARRAARVDPAILLRAE